MAKKKRLSTMLNFLKHLIGINARLVWGMWQLTRLPQPAITVFGGSRIPKDHPASEQACELARRLAEDGFSIITGGGPGIMEAANLGAFEYAKRCDDKKCDHKRCRRELVSMGITVSGLQTEKLNPYVHDQIVMDHFFTRKWMLVRYSVGFIIFPGGFGTLDELFELLTLIKTDTINSMPIVLMGREFWEPLIDMLKNRMLRDDLILKKDFDVIQVVDTTDEAFTIINEQCRECLER